MTDPLKSMEEELRYYVGLQHRLGQDGFHFEDALIGHRRRCIENLLEDEDELWAERVRHLDQLAMANGIRLENEPTLKEALAVVAERERKRRAETIDRRRNVSELAKGVGA